MVIERQFWSEKIRKTFSYRRSSPALGFWRGHGQTDGDRRLLARDRWFELTNESAECVQPATAVSTPKAQRTGRSLIAEVSNFFRPELRFDHREG